MLSGLVGNNEILANTEVEGIETRQEVKIHKRKWQQDLETECPKSQRYMTYTK